MENYCEIRAVGDGKSTFMVVKLRCTMVSAYQYETMELDVAYTMELRH